MVTTFSRRSGGSNPPRVVVAQRPESSAGAPTVVALAGELDTAALGVLIDTFDDAIARDESDVVVDLAGVDFIGAAWIGTLVRTRGELRAQDRELMVRSPSRVAHRLLDLCGLSSLIESTRAGDPGRGPVNVASA